MQVTKLQLRALHASLPKEIKENPDNKAAFIFSFTSDPNRTSSKNLTFSEANAILRNLGRKAFNKPYEPTNSFAKFDAKESSHRKILSLLHEIGWLSPRNPKFADLERFGIWLKDGKAPVNKPLLKQSKAEISKTIFALETMAKNYHKKHLTQ